MVYTGSFMKGGLLDVYGIPIEPINQVEILHTYILD